MLSSHPEGVGTEVIIGWEPQWLKNGERRTYEALRGRIFTAAELNRAIFKLQVIPMRSFVQVYYLLLQGYWNTATTNTTVDTGGTSRAAPGSTNAAQAMDMVGGIGISTYGIVVGSNATAVTRGDTKLNTQVIHGTTSTTLSHGAVVVGAVTNVSTNISQVSVTRTVTGNTGSTVSILEDGIYVNQAAAGWKFMIERNISNFGAVGAAQNVTLTKNIAITT